MKILTALILVLSFSLTALAAPKKKSTEVSFDELLIKGQYHFSDEIVTTVEQDKVLDALLGVRKDFKDKMKRSASRY